MMFLFPLASKILLSSVNDGYNGLKLANLKFFG